MTARDFQEFGQCLLSDRQTCVSEHAAELQWRTVVLPATFRTQFYLVPHARASSKSLPEIWVCARFFQDKKSKDCTLCFGHNRLRASCTFRVAVRFRPKKLGPKTILRVVHCCMEGSVPQFHSCSRPGQNMQSKCRICNNCNQ